MSVRVKQTVEDGVTLKIPKVVEKDTTEFPRKTGIFLYAVLHLTDINGSTSANTLVVDATPHALMTWIKAFSVGIHRTVRKFTCAKKKPGTVI